MAPITIESNYRKKEYTLENQFITFTLSSFFCNPKILHWPMQWQTKTSLKTTAKKSKLFLGTLLYPSYPKYRPLHIHWPVNNCSTTCTNKCILWQNAQQTADCIAVLTFLFNKIFWKCTKPQKEIHLTR